MKIFQGFRDKLFQKAFILHLSPEERIQQSDNPYLRARLEWNFVFGDIRKAKQQWFWLAFLGAIANSLLIIGMIYLSSQRQVIPYVVKVDQLGNALYGGFINQEKTITPLEVNAFLRQYITNARSVILDAFAEKRAMDFVYGVSLPSTRKLLDEYYREMNPFTLAKEELVEVNIVGVIQKSARTWQVNWEEVHRTLEGQESHRSFFEALITISHLTIKNSELLNTNPLGIYIEHINWAQQK